MKSVYMSCWFTLILIVIGTGFGQIPDAYESGLEVISSEWIFNHVYFLASDSMKGRPAGSTENLIAAQYIAGHFEQFGLEPLFERPRRARPDENETYLTYEIEPTGYYNNYFQRFTVQKSTLANQHSLGIIKDTDEFSSITHTYRFEDNFLIQYDGNASISIEAPMVFAGYGIEKGVDGYNDFTDMHGNVLDVHNKIVVIVDGFPQEHNPESNFVRERNAYFTNPLRKAEVAGELGAHALIVTGSRLQYELPFVYKYEQRINSFRSSKYSIPERKIRRVPIIYIDEVITNQIFDDADTDLREILLAIENDLTPRSFYLPGKKMSVEINIESELLHTQNVMAFLEGSDEQYKHEIVVIGAHYDHVGYGYYGALDRAKIGQIHNGADDNASGISALIEVARAFSESQPKRSLLFIAFDAEEMGLLGSRHYVNYQPIKPVENTVAMINLDMVGRNETELLWVGGGFYGHDIKNIAERANTLVGFELLYNVGLLSFASDQAPFLRREIPALFFFSGMHDDYHQPTDTPDKLNLDKIKRVSQLAYLSAWIIANEDEVPEYRSLTLDERKELIDESLKKIQQNRQQSSSGIE